MIAAAVLAGAIVYAVSALRDGLDERRFGLVVAEAEKAQREAQDLLRDIGDAEARRTPHADA
jgi:hypothetical protein